MVSHRNQTQFERARWRKALLFPPWILQIAMLLSLMGIFSYRLAETVENYEENNKNGKMPVVELVWECTNVGLSLVSLLLTILEVSRIFSENLTPFFLLASHIVKLTCAFAILGLDIVVYTQRTEGEWSIIGLAIDVGLLLSLFILGPYAILKFHRMRDDDDMPYSANVKPFGFNSEYTEIETGTVSGGDPFLRANPYNDVTTEYLSRGSIGGVTGRDRSVSATSTLPGDGGRRGSYNHERDTQFDVYRSRAPMTLSHEDVSHAISTELWGNAGGLTAIDRSGSMVGSGMVASRPVQPRVDATNRAASWTVETGRASAPDSLSVPTIHEEHVPDEEEEPTARAAGHVHPLAPGRAEKQALLPGHSRDGSHDDDDDDNRRAFRRIPGTESENSLYGARP
ncbi:hypothetical protein CMQ_715 [Grosmannia clavigera kw1407]|uniref:Uncharacterized protein n=1 Tax=Grosmannia clavigera (strain kw1407 / UAMH 11150) TaxID=655863 RepID=F0XEJ7_GROCL|nr:uncharacterized protein CMQ_715 [Grosmannia clavigera kw1407]EFX03787.1 hypothetical protein CMQ_715 [Grosmannia clavigera kw1407]